MESLGFRDHMWGPVGPVGTHSTRLLERTSLEGMTVRATCGEPYVYTLLTTHHKILPTMRI